MNRKQFIQSIGGKRKNWTWSWGFINHEEKIVIFGAWDIFSINNISLIFSDSWIYGVTGKKNPGYLEAKNYLISVQECGYNLKIFKMIYSYEKKGDSGVGPGKISSIEPKLINRKLYINNGRYYAIEGEIDPDLKLKIDQKEMEINKYLYKNAI